MLAGFRLPGSTCRKGSPTGTELETRISFHSQRLVYGSPRRGMFVLVVGHWGNTVSNQVDAGPINTIPAGLPFPSVIQWRLGCRRILTINREDTR